MITSTMPLLTIHHKTEYRYTHPVAFGEHRIMLRPRDSHDLRCCPAISRSCRSRCRCAGSTTCSATASRSRPSMSAPRTLSIVSTATVEHNPAEEFALTADDPAYFYPFLYNDEEFLDLVQFITPQYGDPEGELSAWARNFLDAEGPTPTVKYPEHMTHGIRNAFTYRSGMSTAPSIRSIRCRPAPEPAATTRCS